MAHMGPPPSPKEPRRSGRRSVPSASSSKSPAPSPVSESAPRSKDTRRTPSTSSSRSKRSKQEDLDETPDEQLKIAPPPPPNPRNKRKNKDKDKQSTPSLDNNHPQKSTAASTEISEEKGGGAEEEVGVTRCVCGSAEDDPDAGEVMVQCETCNVWQHLLCMGFTSEDQLESDDDYYCEQCRPDMHQDLLQKQAKRTRHASANSHQGSVHAPRDSRSPHRSLSPVISKPQKRRNTMNSRDAAYDERVVKALMEATAPDAATAPPHTPVNANDEPDDEGEAELGNRRKRKRTDDDNVSVKRTRSASATSDRPIMSNISREDPVSASGSKATPTPSLPPPKPRQKRGGGRKSVQVAESVASVEVDEAAPPKRPSRAKGTNQESRRSQTKVDTGSTSNTRAHHSSHAYAVAQQPLYTSWNLPDYLAHLEPMLPCDAPEPLEIPGFGKEISTERGAKVKWPSKRTSIGDMNKRVRSLVEWVGREQASAQERGRRKEALLKALREQDDMVLDGTPLVQSPLQEKQLGETDWIQSPTMRMMEEVMEELITFQERFGPGAKTGKERGRVVSN